MTLIESAIYWIALGVDLVPVQPGSKHVVSGFGAYRRRVRDESDARFWWQSRRAGLAVVCGSGPVPGLVVLDFDNPALYHRWQSGAGSAADSYTVQTPRGYHVHIWSDAAGVVGVDGLDVLGAGRVAVTSPTAGDRDVGPARSIHSVKSLDRLPLLSKEKVRSGSSLSIDAGGRDGDDLISAIKAAYPIRQFAEDSGIVLRSSDRGRGRWFAGRCPFHDDIHPSFWIDSARGLWGCHSCGLVGDVVNLYARLHRTSVRIAINELAARLRGCGV